MKEKVKKIFELEASALSQIPVDDNYEKVTEVIYQNIHKKSGKLITSGMGKAGQIAHNIATTFSSTGTPAIFLHPSEAQHGDLGILQENDVLLAISNSGKTREIIELIDLKNNLFPLMPVIVITGNVNSPLAQKADYCISTGSPAEVCLLGLTPTTSTTVFTVIGDALVVLMMEKIEFTPEDYAKRHHGGYLGFKSRESCGQNSRKLLI
jgi:arabinose-5-phosphate isomerase